MTIEQHYREVLTIGSKRVWMWPNGVPGDVPLSFWWLAWGVR